MLNRRWRLAYLSWHDPLAHRGLERAGAASGLSRLEVRVLGGGGGASAWVLVPRQEGPVVMDRSVLDGGLVAPEPPVRRDVHDRWSRERAGGALVFGLCGGVFRLAAAAMLSFAVAVVAAASAFGVMMFLMIMYYLQMRRIQ